MEDTALQQGARSRVEVTAKVVPFTATDQRHSYIKRPHTLVGPGAYSIPSTFRQSAINTLLRAVQREHYGREFARMKRNASASSCTATTSAATPSLGDAIGAMGDATVSDDVPPTADANSPIECGAAATRARQPGGVTADKYRRRRDQLRSQVGRHVAAPAPVSARPIAAAVAVPRSPLSVSSASCYDVFVDGYVPAGADGDAGDAPAVLPPPSPMQRLSRAGGARGRLESSAGKAKLAGLSRDHGRGAPPATTPSYDRYLASTGYLKRLTRHRQCCLGDGAVAEC